jgi:hypothetical protein
MHDTYDGISLLSVAIGLSAFHCGKKIWPIPIEISYVAGYPQMFAAATVGSDR